MSRRNPRKKARYLYSADGPAIDLNTADLASLVRLRALPSFCSGPPLPFMSTEKAASIISSRKSEGPFNDWADLQSRIIGIDENLLRKLQSVATIRKQSERLPDSSSIEQSSPEPRCEEPVPQQPFDSINEAVPAELVSEIFSFLDLHTRLCVVQRVSCAWRDAVRQKGVWRELTMPVNNCSASARERAGRCRPPHVWRPYPAPQLFADS